MTYNSIFSGLANTLYSYCKGEGKSEDVEKQLSKARKYLVLPNPSSNNSAGTASGDTKPAKKPFSSADFTPFIYQTDDKKIFIMGYDDEKHEFT